MLFLDENVSFIYSNTSFCCFFRGASIAENLVRQLVAVMKNVIKHSTTNVDVKGAHCFNFLTVSSELMLVFVFYVHFT